MPRLASFVGDLTIEHINDDNETENEVIESTPADYYYWAKLFLTHAPNMKKVTLNVTDFSDEWIALTASPSKSEN